MDSLHQLQLSRFKRLPQRDDTWEGGIVLLPTWVDEAGAADPYRPESAVWVSTSQQVVHATQLGKPGTMGEAAALAALLEMGNSGKHAGYRPQRIRVRDESLAAGLRQALEGIDLSVEVTQNLPAVDQLLDVMAVEVGGERVPAALDAPGVTVERLRQFAEAAKQFYDATPWNHLDDDDLFRVEKPKPPYGLGLFTVMGSAGEQFGLAFFSSVKRYDALQDAAHPGVHLLANPEAVLFLSPAWETTFSDLSAWDRHGLPLASPWAYPTAICPGGPDGPQRPDADQLAYLEGLLRALAVTSEDQMDSGRWSHTVETASGPAVYTLALPNLLEMSSTPVIATGGETAEDEAHDLIAQAADAGGRWQFQLIRRALDLWPDCADAYTLLARRSSSPAEERALWEQAVAAGERALGPGAFDDPDRELWVDASFRPYTRARMGLADCLFFQGELNGAASHLRALLAIDPDDKLGARYRLLELYLVSDQDAEAAALIQTYDAPDVLWSYASVLLALRAGDQRAARSHLRAAIKLNRHMPKYLTGQREVPEEGPMFYSLGSDEEAAILAIHLIGPWTQTPNAIPWLRAEMRRRK